MLRGAAARSGEREGDYFIMNVERCLFQRLEKLSDQMGWIGGSLAFVMMISVLREVIGRYLLHSPSDWSLELNGYLLVGMTYLASAHTEIHEHHIRVDFIYNLFKGKFKAMVDVIISLIGLCWGGVVTWQSALLALKSLEVGSRSSQAMQWPLFPSQVLVPLGSFLLCLALLGKLIKNVNLLRPERG